MKSQETDENYTAGLYAMIQVLLVMVLGFSIFLKYMPRGKRMDRQILFLAYAATGVLTAMRMGQVILIKKKPVLSVFLYCAYTMKCDIIRPTYIVL